MFDIFSSITFEYPYILLSIIPFIICAKYCKAKNRTYFMPHLHIYSESKKINSSFTNILKWITIIFAIIALASPIKELQTINTKKEGINMVLSLDTSGSMRQIGFDKTDIEKNRWEVVKGIVEDFIDKRINDNIALVVFGTNVMTASPLSYDKIAQKQILNGLDIAVVGENTALIDSIASSINILKDTKGSSKIIIALTDGDDTASTIPINIVLKMAKKYNIKIYTIAIAATNRYILQELSKNNGGKSFEAFSKGDLKSIYETINKLEKSKIDKNTITLKEYYYFYPLFISFLTLLIFLYLKNRNNNI